MYCKEGEMESDLHDKEAKFHDQWAQGTACSEVLVREAFEAPTALENRFILSMMGDLRGKTVLDVGSGLGESSVYFALLGAKVTALDVSPKMIELAKTLAREHGVEIEGVVSPAENLALPDDSFDFVYLGNVIHHIVGREALFGQVRRVLKPGGRFFSWDPLKYNPVINVYRRMASEVRSEDEMPLGREDLATARSVFGRVGMRTFWITALALFLKYYLVDQVDPNVERYWKKIYCEDPGKLGWWRLLAAVDSLLARLPGVRLLAWNVVLWGAKD